MVVPPEGHSAQPGLGVRQEHVLEVLVCQHEHTSTPWLGLVSIPLRRLAQAGTRSPDSASLYCRDTLDTTCSAQGNGKLLGALVYLYIISRSPVSV